MCAVRGNTLGTGTGSCIFPVRKSEPKYTHAERLNGLAGELGAFDVVLLDVILLHESQPHSLLDSHIPPQRGRANPVNFSALLWETGPNWLARIRRLRSEQITLIVCRLIVVTIQALKGGPAFR
jgi:hypothetical protein